MNIKVIGAGLGGLAVSCLLAEKGHDVTVLEKNEQAGGKINEVQAKGFRFDTGPSLLTMPFILESLFKFCDEDINEYLNLCPVDPICRYFYQNNTQFDCYQDSCLNTAQIQEFAPEDVQAFKEFEDYSKQLYERTKEAFLFNPLFGFSDLSSLNFSDFFKIDAFKTVAQRVDQMFESDELRQFFKRFSTYNGSSPFQAPATLNVIPHVELALGGYYLKSGIYSLVKALKKIAAQRGVNFEYGVDVGHISTNSKAVSGVVDQSGDHWPADLVVSNADAYETYHRFLKDKASIVERKITGDLEPSCSGFVMLLGIDTSYDQLSHHNIFFSDNYEREFQQIFEEGTMPDNPTIYVANTCHTDQDDAPEGSSNLFVLVNAPYLSENYDWQKKQESYRHKVIKALEERGLSNLNEHIVYSETISPADFYQRYRSNKGSIYGTSSNSKFSAFLRPRNKSRSVEGLYLVGGSTHPGGGIPLVTLSAFHAAELIERFDS